MASVFITGSADGLGQLAARELVRQGHEVVLHARNADRAKFGRQKVPGAAEVLTADLSSMEETVALSEKANHFGRFDAVIHNAGIYNIPNSAISRDKLPLVFSVNTIAPYILTCLMTKPQRMIYLSSGMHHSGDATLHGMTMIANGEKARISYSDTKLHDVMLAMLVASKWPGIFSNAVNPGWVPTKMGGAGAPDNLEKGYETQVWLAISNDPAAMVGGRYFHHKKESRYQPSAGNGATQEKFLVLCQQITGVHFPVQ